MPLLADNSIDSVVTDPPSGIRFMGKAWDKDKGGRGPWIEWLTIIMREAVRVLKPGGHALVWALPRTAHWTTTACEDAGFEIRDVGIHLFGTGFPKSLTSESAAIPEDTGTALKPAAEHWIVCRKPLAGTVAENFATWGTGVLRIGDCRIGTSKAVPTSPRKAPHGGASGGIYGEFGAPSGESLGFDPNVGRWPAHVTLDDDAAPLLDAMAPIAKPARASKVHAKPNDSIGTFKTTARVTDNPADPGGGVSRFFYVAKATGAEKDEGLDHLTPKSGGEATGREDGAAGVSNPRAGANRGGGRRNHHPTVKSVSLMRWLCRLVTPAGGTVLDMFAGSGTTGIAALAEGLDFIGIEQGGDGGEYWPVLQGRLAHALTKLQGS